MADTATDPPDDLRWQALLSRAPVPIFLLDRRQQLVYVNAAWEELIGLTGPQARGSLRRRRGRRERPFAALEPILQLLRPPPEVLQGQSARRRRLGPAGQAKRSWWEISFFPLGGADKLSAILGTIQVMAIALGESNQPLSETLANLRLKRADEYRLENLESETPALERVRTQARLASQTRVPVLLVGEAGAGKEWVARTIHQLSQLSERREAPFVALDCARLPPLALTAALFGQAIPSAGTVYLRNPARLSRDLQDQFCQHLADQESADAPGRRVMAGSDVDPTTELRAGNLREDLHCRLSPLTIELPPLRERLADLPALAQRILLRLQIDVDGHRRLNTLSPDALDRLHNYPWPGNLRELHTVLATACGRARGARIELGDLPAYLRAAAPTVERALPLKTLLEQVERRLIELALSRAKNNKSRAAESLSIWRALLLRRIKALGIAEEA